MQWSQDGNRRPDLDDRFSWSAAAGEAGGSWRVVVRFETDEIRRDPQGLTTSDFQPGLYDLRPYPVRTGSHHGVSNRKVWGDILLTTTMGIVSCILQNIIYYA